MYYLGGLLEAAPSLSATRFVPSDDETEEDDDSGEARDAIAAGKSLAVRILPQQAVALLLPAATFFVPKLSPSSISSSSSSSPSLAAELTSERPT